MPLYIVVLWVKHIQIGNEKVPPSFVRALLFGATWAILGALWPILGAIWGPAGRQGAPKIDFLAPSRTKNSKNESQNEASKNV